MRVVTLARLQRALDQAVSDFRACGLYTDALHEVPVFLVPVGVAYGWCSATSEICIPAVSLMRLGEIWWPRVALRDVVRHEMAHALANLYEDVVDTHGFSKVFGGGYWHTWARPPVFDPSTFVSPYATKSPAEDFAESIMVVTKYRGLVERYAKRHGVMRKLRFVQGLAQGLTGM